MVAVRDAVWQQELGRIVASIEQHGARTTIERMSTLLFENSRESGSHAVLEITLAARGDAELRDKLASKQISIEQEALAFQPDLFARAGIVLPANFATILALTHVSVTGLAVNFIRPIARKPGTTIYEQVERRLREAITAAAFAPEAAIPTERELAEGFGVSRITIRKALAQLEGDGLLYRRQGCGTFVAADRNRIQKSLSRITSFSEDMRARAGARQPVDRQVAWPGYARGSVVAGSLARGIDLPVDLHPVCERHAHGTRMFGDPGILSWRHRGSGKFALRGHGPSSPAPGQGPAEIARGKSGRGAGRSSGSRSGIASFADRTARLLHHGHTDRDHHLVVPRRRLRFPLRAGRLARRNGPRGSADRWAQSPYWGSTISGSPMQMLRKVQARCAIRAALMLQGLRHEKMISPDEISLNTRHWT